MEKKITCGVKGCEETAIRSGMCNRHWQRTKLYGSPVASAADRASAKAFIGMQAIERFELQHEKTEGCWNWTYSLTPDGYGKFRGTVHGETYQTAHRFSWAFHNGKPVPRNKCVCHTCDNRKCVNPAHLWIGDPVDNVGDMIQKGRKPSQKGILSHRAKLTEAQALAVLADPRMYTEIAHDYGVATTTITSIKNRVSWSHLELDFIPPKNPRGSGSGRRGKGSKINEGIVREIRRSTEPGLMLAKKYGISNVLVSNIRRRIAWAHVTD